MPNVHSTVQTLLAGLSPQRVWFDPGSNHVGYMVGKVGLEHFPLPAFFPLSITIPHISIFIYLSFKGMECVSIINR
jgi:hypothetical protein